MNFVPLLQKTGGARAPLAPPVPTAQPNFLTAMLLETWDLKMS